MTDREKAVIALRQELDKVTITFGDCSFYVFHWFDQCVLICFVLYFFQYRMWCIDIDDGKIPDGLPGLLEELGAVKQETGGSVLM